MVLPSIPPGREQQISWPTQLPELRELAARVAASPSAMSSAPLFEWFLELRTTAVHPTSWCDAGHEVAWTQIPLPSPSGGFASPLSVPRPLRSASVPLRVLDAGDNLLQVQCIGGVHMAFHLDGNFAGTLINLGVRGTQVLKGGPTPCFWRAPTDNDRGGEGISFCARWRNVGLDRLQTVCNFPTEDLL